MSESRLPRTEESGPEAWTVLAWLAIPCLLFYVFIGKTILCLAFAIVTLAVAPFFQTRVDAKYLIACRQGVPASIACAIVAIALTTIGGEGRLLPATSDWMIRDAVLHDLVKQAWPFVYQFDGKNWMLRAPLGMYLIPAIFGKWGGFYAACLALWLQNTLAIFVVLRVFCASTSVARSITVLVVVSIFSGWDTVGALIAAVSRMFLLHTHFRLPDDIGWWAGLFQYSSTMTQVFWVPNHALAGWLFTALLLLWDRRQIGISALMTGAALSIFWSPFALMGALPFLAKAGIEALQRRRISWRDIGMPLLLVVLLVPLGIYLTSDSEAVPRGFQPLTFNFFVRYAVFTSVEVLPFVIINFIFGEYRGGFSKSTYILAVVSLVLFPLYRMGANNDFVMRASIPALAILAITTGHTAYHALTRRPGGQASVIVFVLGIGFLTGLNQMWHILTAHNNGISTCDLIQAWDQDPDGVPSKASYLADQSQVPGMLQSGHPQVHVTGPTSTLCFDQKL